MFTAMTAEERVFNYAMNEIEQANQDALLEYEERLRECCEEARENGEEIEQVVNSALLAEQIFRMVEETRNYWVKRLEAQGASIETIRAIDADYVPEKPYEGDGGGYIAVEE